MLSVDEARARILARLRPVQAETVPLPEAAGRVLAAPVVARLTQPPADVSAMDGYALAAEGEAGRFRVIGAAPAGHPYAGTLRPGEAVRIFTGSVLPPGTTTVLVQEDAEAEGETVLARALPAPGRHIRQAGQDFTAGSMVLQPGQRLGARAIGLAAAANHPWLAVHRRPRVAILATGDEVALPGEPIPPGGIANSNAPMLAAMIRAWGGEPTWLPGAGDSAEAIAAAADTRGTDLLLTTGGASVGAHDLVQAGLGRRGFALDFWKIAMRPGKPMIFGAVGEVPVLGLPGNPVSAFVCGLLFLLPALARLSGLAASGPPLSRARLGAPLRANDHRADHLRARLEVVDGIATATPFEVQDSSMLRLLAEAGALIPRAPHAPPAAAGEEVDIMRLDHAGL